MKHPVLVLPIAILALSTSLFAQAPASTAPAGPAATPATAATPAKVALPPQPPDVAAVKYSKDGQPDKGFQERHQKFLAIAAEGNTDLLFLGDSITAGWNSAKPVWEKVFGAYKPANFGIGGDRTQHVLWRIENGELEGIKPKAVVLMIGTNNSGADSAEGIARGITKIVGTIRAKQPQAKILLLAIFPRGELPTNPVRPKLAEVNKTISKLDDQKHVFYLDIGEKFLLPDGSFNKEITGDFLHLNPKGYEIWADAISPKVAELMK